MYEGRTRGKRLKYTFSDDEDDTSDALPSRRTNRQSGLNTPAEPAGPTITASGRQVKARSGGAYGESMLSGQRQNGNITSARGSEDTEEGPVTNGRSMRARGRPQAAGRRGQLDGNDSADEMDEDEDGSDSGGSWDGGNDDDDIIRANDDDEDEEHSDGGSASDDGPPPSLVVQLRYRKEEKPKMHGAVNGSSTATSPLPVSTISTSIGSQEQPSVKAEPTDTANGEQPSLSNQQQPDRDHDMADTHLETNGTAGRSLGHHAMPPMMETS